MKGVDHSRRFSARRDHHICRHTIPTHMFMVSQLFPSHPAARNLTLSTQSSQQFPINLITATDRNQKAGKEERKKGGIEWFTIAYILSLLLSVNVPRSYENQRTQYLNTLCTYIPYVPIDLPSDRHTVPTDQPTYQPTSQYPALHPEPPTSLPAILLST